MKLWKVAALVGIFMMVGGFFGCDMEAPPAWDEPEEIEQPEEIEEPEEMEW